MMATVPHRYGAITPSPAPIVPPPPPCQSCTRCAITKCKSNPLYPSQTVVVKGDKKYILKKLLSRTKNMYLFHREERNHLATEGTCLLCLCFNTAVWNKIQ